MTARPRRIDDALSQLIDSLTPPLRAEDLPYNHTHDDQEPEDSLAAEEERLQRANLEYAWRVLDAYPTPAPNAEAPSSSSFTSGGGGSGGGLNLGKGEENPSELIKYRLLHENASPDKAVRFSNLYGRLLNQPVLSRKWGILGLLYQISGIGTGTGAGDEGRYEHAGETDGWAGGRSRSPLMDEGGLDNILMKGSRTRRRRGESNPGRGMGGNSEDEGPAVSSSVSQRGARLGRRAWESEVDEDEEEDVTERPRESQSSRFPVSDRMDGPHRQEDMVSARQSLGNGDGAQKPRVPPSERGLLRDIPYNLQGLTSSHLEFVSPSALKLPPALPVPVISLLNTLAEPCLLYRGLSDFLESSDGGLVSQSLRSALSNELRSYLGLVATLEGEIRRALAATKDDEPKSVSKGGVTLKRCVVWTRDATMALRLMSLIVEESRSKKGGQLISLIHGFSSSHGDPFVCAFAEKLLTHVTRPFYDMLRHWIYDGELSDPYNEFFVVEPEFRPSTDPRRIATSVWEDKYKLDDSMVPSIITQDFAKKVFLIGKSLNFIRYGCGDSGWVEAYSKEASKELRYGDTATLEASIDEAYKTTMARLIHLMAEKFRLFDHLAALKKYLLLGQGDFIALLMESLASNLDRPANSQYRHTLTAQLEHAIRASNAQYDSPDVLRRLDARMLELSHGEIGWDCFTLEYKIDAPVDVVITPWGSTQYLKVFNFLWRVKRVEFALGSTWRRCMTGARGVLGSVDDKVGADWKRARCAIAEMIHFICQLQYYILFEVIEASWDQLQAAVSKPGCTLDDLIEAHTKYLNSITHKGLLGSSSSSRSSSSKHHDAGFLSQLHQILKLILAYKDAVDGLYSFSVAEFTRRQELSARIETRTAQGRWGISERDYLPPSSSRQSGHKTSASSQSQSTSMAPTPNIPGGDMDTPSSSFMPHHDLSADDNMLESLRVRLRDLAADFKSRLNILLGDLAYQPDVDMRFLGVVMNFNDVYEPVRRRRTVTGSGSRDRDREREKEREKEGGREKTREREKERMKRRGTPNEGRELRQSGDARHAAQ